MKNEARYRGKCVKLCNSDLHHFEHDHVGLASKPARDQFFCWKKISSAKTSVEVQAPLQQPHRHILGALPTHRYVAAPAGRWAWRTWGIHPRP